MTKLPQSLFKILNGPSKFDLMSSLFEGKTVEITCGFNAENSNNGATSFGHKIEVVFTTISVEDGSHDSWLGTLDFRDQNYEKGRRQFYYDTRRRTGHIREITK